MDKESFLNKIFTEIDEQVSEKLDSIEVYHGETKYYETFVIATGSFDSSKQLVTITNIGDTYGVGEAPLRDLGEEELELIKKEIKGITGKSLTESLQFSLNDTISMPTKLSLSMSLLDLYAKLTGKRYGELFGDIEKERVETDITIGIKPLSDTIKDYERFREMGFTKFKIKLGENIVNDIEKVKKLSEIVDEKVSLRFDANQGWKPEEAIKFIDFMNKLDVNIEFLEQPLPKDKYVKIGDLKKLTDIPIILDESVRKSEDVIKVSKFTDGVNLKPVKAENVLELVFGYLKAKELDLLTMIGCSSETNIGITSSTFIASIMNVNFADLDSDILQEDILKKKITPYERGLRLLPKGPGLGIKREDINFEKLVKLL